MLITCGPLAIGNGGLAIRLSWLVLSVLCLSAIGLSVHLLLDAALFRLAGSYPDEAEGLTAIDDVLTRMGFGKPARGRSLGSRIAGSRRIVLKQRIVLAGGLVAAVCLVLGNANGLIQR
ncbi:hypothetical protein [Bosea sp. PAMC 26642]|uniref:hypothetical protein n=1 Tax=Bosea sp. (strain PAMC 26642) TaxID=1792307 RepID=UPI002FF51BE8